MKRTGGVTSHGWWRLEHAIEFTEFVRLNEKEDQDEKFFQSAAEMLEYYNSAYEVMREAYKAAGFGPLVFDDEVAIKEGFDF